MSKKVSILIPLYNAEAFITATIQSVLKQRYENIEVIIVDDHSSDDSFEMAQKFTNDQIKLVKNTGKGACAARNFAYSLSSGDLIQYLDADDLMDPNKIESQVKSIIDDDTMAFGNWARFTSGIEEVKLITMSIHKNYEQPIDLLADCWTNEEMVPIHSWLTPRKLIEKAGPWKEELSHNQDGEFFSRVVAEAQQINYVSEAKVYYRSNVSTSISSESTTEKNAESQLLSYQCYVQNLQKHLTHPGLKKALGTNFLGFIYRFYGKYPHLVSKAEQEFNNLGLEKMWPVGGAKFKKLAAVVGFKNALKLRKSKS